FDLLGVQPQLGRMFSQEEDEPGHNNAVLLSDSLWRGRVQADTSIVGRGGMLNHKPHLIICVLPPSLQLPTVATLHPRHTLGQPPEIFKPLGLATSQLPMMYNFDYGVVGRLREDVSRDQALAELNVIEDHLVKMSGENLELRSMVKPLQDHQVGHLRKGLLVL